MSEIKKFLVLKNNELDESFNSLLAAVDERIQEKNDKIAQIKKQNEYLIEQLEKQTSKRSFRSFEYKFLFAWKRLIKVYRNNIKQAIAIQQKETEYNKTLVKIDKSEAFQIIVNELEKKKNIIDEQNKTISVLNTQINELSTKNNNIIKQNTELETQKQELLEQNSNNINKINECKGIIDKQQQMIENNKYINNENNKLKNDLENSNFEVQQKDKLLKLQENTIKTLSNELDKKNDDIVELKTEFLELINNFNNIIEQVE